MAQQKLDKDYGKLLLKWNFPEYVKYKRGRLWYFIATVATIAIIIYAFWQANYLFVILLIIFAFIMIIHSKGEPAKVDFRIFEDGISIGSKFYQWSDIKSFSLIYQPPEIKRLYIDLENTILHDFSVPLEDQDPVKVRKILGIYLKEDLTKKTETLTDRLGRVFKI